MKNYFVLTLLIVNQFAFSQDWCHQGSKWTYNYYSFGSSGYIQYSYELDTTIQSIPCKKLSSIFITATGFPNPVIDTTYPAPLFTYSRDDTAFFFNPFKSVFSPTYFFSANLGDTINYADPRQFHCPNDSIYHYLIENKETININGVNLRSYRAKAINFNSSFLYPDTIRVVERIGSTQAMKPFHTCVTDEDDFSLRCYKDDSFAVYQISPQLPCNYLTGINDETNAEKFKLSPNPTASFLFINNQTPQSFEIKNILGQSVMKNTLNVNQPIDINKLQKGTYFFEIIHDQYRLSNTIIKFVKN